MARKGYRFRGVASVFTEGALFERILDFYRTERNLDEGRTKIRSFVLVKINEAMPVICPAYDHDHGLTEAQVREKKPHYFVATQEIQYSPGGNVIGLYHEAGWNLNCKGVAERHLASYRGVPVSQNCGM